MPFLALPARPIRPYWKGWITYGAIVVLAWLLTWRAVELAVLGPQEPLAVLDVAAVLALLAAAWFLLRHRYLLGLLGLALPVAFSLRSTRFDPSEGFLDVHSRAIGQLADRGRKLRVLDISTGTCNSLHRHGWMDLDAHYTAVDLSETMLLQGRRLMAKRGIPVDFVLADAADLPFCSETFDVVLNYGAINGMTDIGLALAEMSRVTRPGGLVLFFDEQLYDAPSRVERLYFRSVLSSHNVIDRCPVELLPSDLERVDVRQVYPFYYLCIAFKRCRGANSG